MTPLELPTDRPRPGTAATGTGRAGLTLPAGPWRRETLLTAFAVLLARHTGQWEVPLGTEDGTLLPCPLAADLAFEEAERRVREAVPGPSAEPCPVAFGLGPEARTPATELALWLRPEPDGTLSGELTYATALFDQQTAERLAARYVHLLTDAARRPGAALHQLEPLPADERELLLHGWNDTAVQRTWTSVSQLIAEQTRSTPEAIALVDAGTPEGAGWTYRELDERAERYARRLRALGAGPESLVAVVLDRTPELVACVLGVWKAGAAYVPVNPELPADRLHFMIEDSGATVVVTEPAHRALLPEGYPGAVLETGAADAPEADGDTAPDAGNLAYLIYTSGSTGRPKGVLIEHRSLANLLFAMRDQTGSGGNWLAVTSTSFDISGLELYLPLVTGGRIVLAGPEQTRDGGALLKAVEIHGVTHVQATPSSWKLLLQAGFDAPEVTALVGGEALPLDLAQALRPRVGRLLNVYGPTETTIWSTSWEVPENPQRVAIGRPLQNTTTYVLDEHRRPVPLGVAGELCIGGTGLARGYRNRPEETAARFVDDPFGPAGARLYRTGDIVRIRPDGTLEYLDRADNQVKIRGHRIEPDEIAAVLRTHRGVADALVVAARIGEDRHLVAYWIPADPQQPVDGAELAAHCRAALPEYMVPIGFLALDAFPLNLSGKVDRKALPVPDLAALAGEDDGERPPLDGPVAERLAGLWSELFDGLAVTHGGHHFFRLGGTSLLAARLLTAIREHLGATLPLSAVFANPTLAGLAGIVETALGAAAQEDVQGDEGEVRLPPQPVSYLEDEGATTNRYLCRVTWWIEGPLDLAALAAALPDVHWRHQALHARYDIKRGLALLPADGDTAPRLTELPPVATEQAAIDTALAELFEPLSPSTGRVWRAGVVRAEDTGRTLLCVVAHHAAFDGLSNAPFAADLGVAYQARLEGREPVFDTPTPTLAQHAAEFHKGLALADLDAQRSFWAKELRRMPELVFPQYLRAKGASGPLAEVSGTVTAAELAPWDEHGRRTGGTRFALLAGAYGAALAHFTGHRDLSMLVPLAKRTALEGITCRIDALCVRLRSAGEPGWLDAARETVSAAQAAQDLVFHEVMRGAFMAGSGPAVLNLPMLILHDEEVPDLRLPGCRTELLHIPPPTTANEVELAAQPQPDGGLHLMVSVRADRLPESFGQELLDELVRILRAGPGAAAAVREGQDVQEGTH
ncbi:amino acid adenylation domain-containing protein [Streptomyces sp. NPDC052396]|uniref:amino acid adenylation domain-containing protein n=1 Tax=Streptomyces sp. NPDC052396 TaxID=3365689 RepID=UPI0037D434A5